jgi:hypothetical protein
VNGTPAASAAVMAAICARSVAVTPRLPSPDAPPLEGVPPLLPPMPAANPPRPMKDDGGAGAQLLPPGMNVIPLPYADEIRRVKTEDEAIALANDSDFGLGGSVWTRDEARGLRLASRIDTGMMFINNIDWTDAELPFGGIKQSGYGREGSRHGIEEYLAMKYVCMGGLG